MIRKAVIPAAGLGTRFYPVTKAQPKEMLPIWNKPTIQYVVEELVASGITDITIVTGRAKSSIENHFDKDPEFEEYMSQVFKANIFYTRQPKPRGLADALLWAEGHVINEPFAVALGDDIIRSSTPCLTQLLGSYEKTNSPVVAVKLVDDREASKFGIVEAENYETSLFLIRKVIEKPVKIPSNYAVVGRYIFTPEIFDYIRKTNQNVEKGEVLLTDVITNLAQNRYVYAHKIEGDWFSIGDSQSLFRAWEALKPS